MKFINKIIPLLSILLLTLFITINNQKEKTRLKILIWTTPSISLGTYIGIANGTGYILSYLLTTNLYKSNKSNIKQQLNYKIDNKKEEVIFNPESSNEILNEKTFIERDFKEPSPTIKASFRVISNSYRENELLKDDYPDQKDSYEISDEIDYNHTKPKIQNDSNKIKDQVLDDWDDYSYINW